MAEKLMDGMWAAPKLLESLKSDLATEMVNHSQRIRWHEIEVKRLEARIKQVEDFINGKE
jgi:hypothetical protein